jgi:hypothetical protein
MRIFKVNWFTRFASKVGIQDDELKSAVNSLEVGQVDANLGGGVYKVRIARPGEGKSGGYRVIVFFRSGDRTFFVYGFAKSDRPNISRKEVRLLKRQAKELLFMSDAQINRAVQERIIKEIREHEDDKELSQ